VDDVIGSSDSLRSRLDVRYKDGTPVTRENSKVTEVLATGEPVRGCVLRYATGGDAPRWVRGNFHPLLRADANEPWGVVCSFVDVTDADGAEARLRDFSRQMRTVLADESAVVYVQDRQGRYLFANRRLGQLLGLARSEIIGKTQAEVLPADLNHERAHSTAAVLEQRGVVEAEETFELDGERRTYLAVKFPLLDDADEPWAIAGVSIDITDRLRAEQAREQQLVRAAFHDRLTGCANRELLAEHLARALGRVQRSERSVVLVFFDVDDLKAVNDHLGHAAGDALLRVLAQRLRRSVRRADVVGLLDAKALLARYGGDEFVLLLSDLEVDVDVVVRAVITRVDEALTASFEYGGHTITPSVSYGVSMYPKHGVTAEDLLDHADAAMYEMKRRRRPPNAKGARDDAWRRARESALDDRVWARRARDPVGPDLARLAAVARRQAMSIIIHPELGEWSVMLVTPGDPMPKLRARAGTLSAALSEILVQAATLDM
jgi:diguanylate cyclase (GGDEF)-like protein/PAS domain S-box-containing protein